jgi:cytosine/adenosine deaminase-related metal-dependent hydrolase
MRRKLIKVAIVSMDPAIGDLRKGDVLIEDDRIIAVGPNIAADDADTIDASRMLLLPGLINGHLHTWQTGLRGLAADWTVAEYMQAMHRGLATLFQSEDVYIANLMGALIRLTTGQPHWLTGVTTILRRSTAMPPFAAWTRQGSAHCFCMARPNQTRSPASGISVRCQCRGTRSSVSAKDDSQAATGSSLLV